MKMLNKSVRNLFFTLTAVCMMIVLLPVMTQAAYISGTTGTGTEDDPIVVDTFDELNQAMRSTVNYIELAGNATINLPAQGSTDGVAAIAQLANTTKHLKITGNVTFVSSGQKYLISVPASSRLIISGDGQLTFESSIYYQNMWNSACMLYLAGRCEINDAVKLYGKTSGSNEYITGVRIVDVNAGHLIVKGNPDLRGAVYNGKGLHYKCQYIAAVTVRNHGSLEVYGGKFHMDFGSMSSIGIENANITDALGLYVYYENHYGNDPDERDPNQVVNLYGGSFKGIGVYQWSSRYRDFDNESWCPVDYLLGDDTQTWLEGKGYTVLNDSYSPYTIQYISNYPTEGGGSELIFSHDYKWVYVISPKYALFFDDESPEADKNDGGAIMYAKTERPYTFRFTAHELSAGYKAAGYKISRLIKLYEEGGTAPIHDVYKDGDETEYIEYTCGFPVIQDADSKDYRVEYVMKIIDTNDTYDKIIAEEKEYITVRVSNRIDLDPYFTDNMIEPKVGAASPGTLTFGNDSWTVTGNWYEVSSNGTVSQNPMKSGELFKAKTKYRLIATAKIIDEDNYRFVDDSRLIFNFSSDPINSNVSRWMTTQTHTPNTLTAYYDVTLPDAISEISLKNMPSFLPGSEIDDLYYMNQDYLDSSEYYVSNTQWYQKNPINETWEKLNISDKVKLVALGEYKIEIKCLTTGRGPQIFAENVVWNVNGAKEPATLKNKPAADGNNVWATFEYEFICMNLVTDINFSMDIAPGKSIDACNDSLTHSVSDDLLEVSGITWSSADGGDEDPGVVLTEGEYYTVSIVMKTTNGITFFSKDVAASFNGEPMGVVVNPYNGEIEFVTTVRVPICLKNEDIKISLPTVMVGGAEEAALIVGEPLPVPVPPEGTEITEYSWKRVAPNGNTFETGADALADPMFAYTCTVKLQCLPGYYFDLYQGYTGNVYSGGVGADIMPNSSDNKRCSIYPSDGKKFTCCVNAVSVTGVTEPRAGTILADMAAAFDGTADSAGVNISGVSWTGETTADGCVIPGNTYTLTFTVKKAGSSTHLTDDLQVQVNGKKADVEIIYNLAAKVEVSFTVNSVKMINLVIREPFAGETASVRVLGISGASLNSKNRPYWYNGGKFSGTFEAGKTYTVMIPIMGTAADIKDAVVFINGVEAKVTIHPTDGIILSREFTVGGAGVTVTGTVTTYGAVDTVTIELTGKTFGKTYSETVQGGNGESVSYTIEGVKPDTYTVKVSKVNHVTREYTVTISN